MLLRRLSSGSDFDVPSMGPAVRDFALRAKALSFVAFEGSYDAYFVSKVHGRGADGDISIALEEASEPAADSNSLLWFLNASGVNATSATKRARLVAPLGRR